MKVKVRVRVKVNVAEGNTQSIKRNNRYAATKMIDGRQINLQCQRYNELVTE